MISQEQITQFRTLGFICCKQLLSQEETSRISDAFDAAMKKARDGAEEPDLQQNEQGYSSVRQQIIPFFDYDPEAFYPLLEDERIVSVFEALMGDDFIITVSEGIIHAGGSGWHHDACAPEGFFSMRAAIYLDPLGPENGCLNVIPGSHFSEFREALVQNITKLGVRPQDVPGTYPVINEPGDVFFMNHKTFHASLSGRVGRRAIHINCSQNTTPEKNKEHYEWLMNFLGGQSAGHRFYSDRLIRTASPRLGAILARAIDLGFGNTGKINQLQDLQ